MSRHRKTVVAAVLLLAGFLLWQATRIGPEAPPPLANGKPAAAAPATGAVPPPNAPRRPEAAPPERSMLADALNS